MNEQEIELPKKSESLSPEEQEWLSWMQDKPQQEIAKMLHSQSERARMTGKDALTGLNNRDGINLMFPHIRAEAIRDKQDIEIIMVDLDNLKTVNDSRGHSAGDELLVETSKRLVREVRGIDIVGRWGGDEFLIIGLIKPNDPKDVLINRIRSSLIGYIKNGEDEIKASVGHHILKDYGDFDEAVKEADANMYREKQDKKIKPDND